ncbi:MAG: hypothetical protein PUF50_03345 [Erysipelotrichaceae bacterium]|nr:hypothetical protein [Erysipelotrichaceae bacterium]
MIENMNDLLSVLVLTCFFIYSMYYGFRIFTFHRLAKHIRDEEKYYRNWEE